MPGTGCVPLSRFPNASVAEYGEYHNEVFATMAEIYMRGPVKASVDATHLTNYTGGVMWDAPKYRVNHHNHGVSIVGWGYDEEHDKQYWVVRNSWGSYWGEMGFFRVELGKNLLMIESKITWAMPGTFSVSNYPCSVDGDSCLIHHDVVDPSNDMAAVKRRLRGNH